MLNVLRNGLPTALLKRRAGSATWILALLCSFLADSRILAQERSQRTSPADFARDIRPIFQTHCFGCHGEARQRGKLDLERYSQSAQVIGHLKVWQAAVDRVAAGSMPPASKPQLSDKERELIARWMAGLICQAEEAEPTDPGPSFPRRITRREYRNTVRDLLGFDADVETYLPETRSESGYDNQLSQLTFPPELLEQYLLLAESVVHGMASSRGSKDSFSRGINLREGEPKLAARQAAEKNLRLLARMAFRRPPDEREVALLLKPFDRAAAIHPDFLDNQRFAIKALLVMPQFLYRTETLPDDDKPAPIDGYAMAGRMAAFLWSSVPDEQLLHAASAGDLGKPEMLRTQVRRMLQDPKIGRLASEFPEQWLFGRLQTHPLDTVTFPDYTPSLAKGARDELTLCFQKLLTERRSLIELLDCDYTFVNDELAAVYAIKTEVDAKAKRDKGAAGMREVKLTDTRRGGLLGMAIAHQKTSMSTRTSPTNRGKWVLDALLGTPPPPPPPDVNNSVDQNAQDPNGQPLTLREKLDLHGKQGTACANCHLKMDPLGFSLENFDPIGRYRDTDGDRPIVNTGRLPDGTELNGIESLKRVLLTRKDAFVRNLAAQLLTYALGRDLETYDLPTVRRVTDAVIKSGYRADVLIEEIILSYPFRHLRAPRPEELARNNESKP